MRPMEIKAENFVGAIVRRTFDREAVVIEIESGQGKRSYRMANADFLALAEMICEAGLTVAGAAGDVPMH